MSHLVRASAALGSPRAGRRRPAALAAKAKPKHTTTVRTVTPLPTTTPKNLSRKCGTSKSATKIRSRRTSRPTKNRIRTITTYCNGGTRTRFTIKRPATAQDGHRAGPGPGRHAAARGPPRARRPSSRSGSRCCTTTTASPSTSSATRSPTTAASPASRPCSTACAPRPTRPTRVPPASRQGHGHDQLGRQLPRRPEPARVLPALRRGQRPVLRLATRSRRIGYDAVTIGNHEYDFGPTRLAQFIAGERQRRAVPVGQHRLQRRAGAAGAARQRAGSPTRPSSSKGGQQIGIIGVSPPETPTISSPRNVKFDADVAGHRQRRGAAADRRGREQDHPVLAPAEHRPTSALVEQLQNVDIVISGGADDLLANPGDLLVPVADSPGPVGPYPLILKDATGNERPARHDPGRVPLRRPPDGHVRRRRQLIQSTDTTQLRPGARLRRPGATRLRRPRTPTLKAHDHRPAGRLQGRPRGEHDRDHRGAARRRQPEPDPPEGEQPRQPRRRRLPGRARTAPRRPTAARWPTSRSPTAAASAPRSPARATSPRRARSTCCRSTTCIVTVPNVTAGALQGADGVGRRARCRPPTAASRRSAGFKMTVDTTRHRAGPGRGSQRHHAGPADHVAHARRRHEDRRERRGGRPGAPSVNLATTNFTANNGDSYPFRGLPFAHVAGGRDPYQQSLFDFITTTSAADGGLGGLVTAARYPVGGSGRIIDHPVAARVRGAQVRRPASRAPSCPCAGGDLDRHACPWACRAGRRSPGPCGPSRACRRR